MNRSFEIFKKDHVVGLDIGSSSIKCSIFDKTNDRLLLSKIKIIEIESAGLKQDPEKIAGALKTALKGIPINKSKFIVSINSQETAVRRITAPPMPKTELKEALKMEAKNYFPFATSDALLDFEIVGEITEGGVKKSQLLLAASSKETVHGILSLLGKAGVKPCSLMPAPYVLQKIARTLPLGSDGAWCFLDIGERYTELAIFSAGGTPASQSLMFSRKIPVAGGDFTKAMTAALTSEGGKTELSLPEAERIKRKVGIPQEGGSQMIEDKISSLQVLSMIRPFLEQLAGEINRCFDYYREETQGGKIDSLILLGGGALLRGLDKFLADELGIEVKVGDLLAQIEMNGEPAARLSNDKNESTSCRLGLCMGAVLSEGKGINLLPPEIKEETKQSVKRGTTWSAAAAAILLPVFIYTGMRIELGNWQKKTLAAKAELSNLAPQLREAAVLELEAGQPYWEDVFKEISGVIPENIFLTEMTAEGKILKMKGAVVLEGREEALSNFIFALEKGIFKNVKLVTARELKEKAANEFELAAELG